MDLTSLVIGGMAVIIAQVFYSIGREDILEVEIIEPESGELVVTEGSRKTFDLLCANCRKFKRHREVEPRVFECTKCNRRTNLRVS